LEEANLQAYITYAWELPARERCADLRHSTTFPPKNIADINIVSMPITKLLPISICPDMRYTYMGIPCGDIYIVN